MNKNNDVDHTIPKEQLRNKSSWFDAMLGRVRTDDFDNFYENVPTKLGSKFDNNEKLMHFSNKLEEICIETVESGEMTKDLAILISQNHNWLNTQDFLNTLQKKLEKKLS